jgi:hypothetical protein
MSQATFRFLADIAPRELPARPARRAAGTPVPAEWNKMDYDMALTRALHRHVLSHPVYVTLIAAAHGQFYQPAPYTISRIAEVLSLTYHGAVWHLRKYPDLFAIDESRSPHRVTLSAEGQQLLADVHRSLHLYRSHSHE